MDLKYLGSDIQSEVMRIFSDEMSEVVEFKSYTIRSEVGINVYTHTELALSQETLRVSTVHL